MHPDQNSSLSPTQQRPSRAKTSTLLPGFHKYPNFYACYLLRSYQNGKMGQRTYVGSTPDPPRRFRQHNGQLKGGAVRTKYYRPWEMELICYGFPSKLVALQFEWVWNTPYKSRHLQIEKPIRGGTSKSGTTAQTYEGEAVKVSDQSQAEKVPMFPKSLGNRLEVKLKVLRKMMTIKPWSQYPLKVLFFEESAYKLWFKHEKEISKQTVKAVEDEIIESKNPSIEVGLRPEGVDGLRKQRRGLEVLPGDSKKPLDVDNDEATLEDYEKMEEIRSSCKNQGSLECFLCGGAVVLEEFLTYATCLSPKCLILSHLLCLSKYYLEQEPSFGVVPQNDSSYKCPRILPDRGSCPSCFTEARWGELIQNCYRRMAANRPGHKDSTLSESENEKDDLNSEDTSMYEGSDNATPSPGLDSSSISPKKTKKTPTKPKKRTHEDQDKKKKNLSYGSPKGAAANFLIPVTPITKSKSSQTNQKAQKQKTFISPLKSKKGPRDVQSSKIDLKPPNYSKLPKYLKQGKIKYNPKKTGSDEDEPEEEIIQLMNDLDFIDE